MDANEENQTILGEGENSAQWSPDASHISVVVGSQNHYDGQGVSISISWLDDATMSIKETEIQNTQYSDEVETTIGSSQLITVDVQGNRLATMPLPTGNYGEIGAKYSREGAE